MPGSQASHRWLRGALWSQLLGFHCRSAPEFISSKYIHSYSRSFLCGLPAGPATGDGVITELSLQGTATPRFKPFLRPEPGDREL